jgi:hypothetical protein
MPADVREFFERVDAQPSSEFSEALLAQLRNEYVHAVPDGHRSPDDAPTAIDLVDEQATTRRTRRSASRNAFAAVAAVLVAATVVAVIVTRDGADDAPPTDPASTTTTTTRRPLPTGLTLLPPEGAASSNPAAGQLVAVLPIPIWVYEDGRVISARWHDHDNWNGFLEQRLTPAGVELVRGEMRAVEGVESCPAGMGSYGYSDGGRTVGESPGSTTLCAGDPRFLRLSELPFGARSWLPANAWADPKPKPYAPTAYQVQINTVTADQQEAGPMDTAAMLATLPPEVAGLLTRPDPCAFPSFGMYTLCFRVTTDEARLIAEPVRSWYGKKELSMATGAFFAGYWFAFLPYLPHDSPVWCCGG